MEERLFRQLTFIKEIDKIKKIIRKSRHFTDDKFENDAEHSWHIAMMALVLNEHSNEKVDILKVVKMLLIHDIVEIDAGDIIVYNKTDKHTELEKAAADRIFGLLPDDQKAEYYNLWIEFEDRKTPEAKFAHSLDRMEPVLQNVIHDGETWFDNTVTYDRIIDINRKIGDGSSALWNVTKDEIDGLFIQKKYHPFDK